ncbi:hypothetical protein MMC29_002146 [Sticta canariensis]|nr:hypothetical protein [Sticta canariensis]
MRWIGETGDPHHPGRKHISQLLDRFYHDGPKRRHLCFVLELLGPQVSAVAEQCRNYRLDGNLTRRVSQQLLYATNHVHSCRIAHGDIHMDIVVFRIPELAFQHAIEDVSTSLIGKLLRIDGAPLEKDLPEYLVKPAEWAIEILEFVNEVQLIDIGGCMYP